MYGAFRQRKSFAMTVKSVEVTKVAEPLLRNLSRRHLHLKPADFLDRIPADRRAQRLADQLPAQTMAENRNIPFHGVLNQPDQGRNPGQIVIDAHRPAHEAQPGKCACIRRNRLTEVHTDDALRNPFAFKDRGKIGRPFGRGMAEDGDRFHAEAFDAVTGV